MGKLLDTLDRQEELRKKRRGLLVEKLDNANAKAIVAQVGTEVQGPPDPIAINPLGAYSSSEEFVQVVKKAQEKGMEALTADERRSIEAAITHRIIEPEAIQPTRPWLRLKQKIERANAETVSAMPGAGGVLGLRVGAAVLKELGLPVVDMMKAVKSDTPMPVSPYRDLKKNPLSPREEQLARQYDASNPIDRAGALATHITTGAIGGLFDFFTGTLDQIVNPPLPKAGEASGAHSPHAKIVEIAGGLVDMIAEAPDQLGHVAEVIYGSRNNPVTKLLEGVSMVANAPKLIAGDKNYEQLRADAINHFYEHPENLLFAQQILKAKAGIFQKAKESADLSLKVEKEAKRAVDQKAAFDQEIARVQEELRIERDRAAQAETQRDQAQQTIEKAVREKKVPVSIEEQNLGEIKRIQEADRATLVNEIMDMQQAAKKPMTPEEVVALTRDQLEYHASGGRIGSLEPVRKDVSASLEEIQKPTIGEEAVNKPVPDEFTLKQADRLRELDEEALRISEGLKPLQDELKGVYEGKKLTPEQVKAKNELRKKIQAEKQKLSVVNGKREVVRDEIIANGFTPEELLRAPEPAKPTIQAPEAPAATVATEQPKPRAKAKEEPAPVTKPAAPAKKVNAEPIAKADKEKVERAVKRQEEQVSHLAEVVAKFQEMVDESTGKQQKEFEQMLQHQISNLAKARGEYARLQAAWEDMKDRPVIEESAKAKEEPPDMRQKADESQLPPKEPGEPTGMETGNKPKTPPPQSGGVLPDRKPKEKTEEVGFSSHGRFADASEIYALEKERGNVVSSVINDPALEAIWTTERPEQAVRYNRAAGDYERPVTKEEISEINEVDLRGMEKVSVMDDGDGGSLWVRRKDGRPLTEEQRKSIREAIEEEEVRTEQTAAGEQVTFAGDRQVPDSKLRNVGKKTDSPQNQGDLMNPGKIEVGNLPQDQVGMFDKPAPVKPEKIDTGFEAADAARNLAHTKRFIQSLEERINASDGTPEQLSRFREQLVEAKAEEAIQQKRVDEIRDKVEQETSKKLEEGKAPQDQPPVEDAFASKQQWEMIATNDLNVDTKRFQGRETEFSEKSVERITENFDANEFDPIEVWRDPKDGKVYVLSGHSRFEAAKRLGLQSVPVVYRTFDEAGAIKYGVEEANRKADPEGIISDLKVYRAMRDRGAPTKEFVRKFGSGQLGRLEALSYLDQKGKFVEQLPQEAKDVMPYLNKWARAVGELRKELGEKFTNRHENQIFDALRDDRKKAQNWHAEDMKEIIREQMNRPDWKPSDALRFDAKSRRIAADELAKEIGSRADMAHIIQKLDKLREHKERAFTPEEKAKVQGEIDELLDQVRKVKDNQQSLFTELGFLGTPQVAIDLYRTLYNGATSIVNYARTSLHRATRPNPQYHNDAMGAMIDHHTRIREAEIMRYVGAKEFARTVPEQHWVDFIHAWQQGPRSSFYQRLPRDVQQLVDQFRRRSHDLEDWAINEGLIDAPKDRPAGHEYVFQHFINPKTGEPYIAEYGKFAKTAPQLAKKKYPTYEEALAAGLEMATKNPAELFGHSLVALTKADASRKLYAEMHSTVFDVNTLIEYRVGNRTFQRPVGIVESWTDLSDQGLTKGYIRVDDPFLDRDLRITDRNGHIRVIKGAIGIREEVYPWFDAYKNGPTYTKLDKVLQAVKGTFLTGFFHPIQLGMQEIAMGRVPYANIRKGLKLLENADPITQNLMKYGLETKMRDIGVDYTNALRWNATHPLAKAVNTLSWIPRWVSHVTFDVIHPGMKTSFAYDTYLKIAPEYRRRGLPEEYAYRDAVKMADNLFSGEDYKRALLESNKFTIDYFYSATARRRWHRMLLSPQWQASHIRAFVETTKATIPDAARRQFGLAEKGPIAERYHKYLIGALTLYTSANLYNWVATKHMDGDGKVMWQNEPGKRFRVRALWNDPDGRPVYLMPFKSIFEVPEMATAAISGELGKFTAKLAPYLGSMVRQATGVDEFGNKRYDAAHPPNLANRTVDVLKEQLPITLSSWLQLAEKNKSPLSVAASNLGFPASKGYPGGEFGMRIDEAKVIEGARKDEIRQKVDRLIANGDIDLAVEMMVVDLGYDSRSVYDRLLKNKAPLMEKWTKLSDEQKVSFLLSLPEEEQVKFWNEIEESSEGATK